MADVLLQSIQQAVVDASLKSTTTCQSTISGDQNISITCRNDNLTDHYESNPTCVSCIKNQLNDMKSQFSLQIASWNAYQPSTITVNQDIDASYTQFMNGLETCVDVCKMCKLEDTSQESVLQIDATCQINSEEYNSISNELIGNLSNSSFISNGDIDKMIQAVSGGKDRDTMRTTLINLVQQSLSVDVITGMLGHISSNQSMIIQSSGATSIKGLQQSTVISLGTEFLSSSKFTTDFTNTSEWKSISEYYQKNSTVDALGQTIVQLVYSVGNTIGGIIEIVIYVLGALICMLIILYIIFWFVKRK